MDRREATRKLANILLVGMGVGVLEGCTTTSNRVDPGVGARRAYSQGRRGVFTFTYGEYLGDRNGDGLVNNPDFTNLNHTVFHSGQDIGFAAQCVNMAGMEIFRESYRNGEMLNKSRRKILGNAQTEIYQIQRRDVTPHSTFEVYWILEDRGSREIMGKSVVRTIN